MSANFTTITQLNQKRSKHLQDEFLKKKGRTQKIIAKLQEFMHEWKISLQFSNYGF